MTQFELAAKVGKKELTISRLERGDKRVKIATRARIAEVLGLQYDWKSKSILPPTNLPASAFGPNDNGETDLPAGAHPIEAKPRRVPVHRLVPASRLGGPDDMYTVPPEPDEYVEVSAPSPKCVIVQIDGDCMTPVYKDGDHVLIDFDAVARAGLVPGAAYYVQLRGEGDGKATFKRFKKMEGDVAIFDCINQRYKKKIRISGNFNAGLAVATVAWRRR